MGLSNLDDSYDDTKNVELIINCYHDGSAFSLNVFQLVLAACQRTVG
jgi:hypothetical protein